MGGAVNRKSALTLHSGCPVAMWWSVAAKTKVLRWAELELDLSFLSPTGKYSWLPGTCGSKRNCPEGMDVRRSTTAKSSWCEA